MGFEGERAFIKQRNLGEDDIDSPDMGDIIYDESGLPEMRTKMFKKKMIRIVLGLFFITMGIYVFWLGLDSQGWDNEMGRNIAFLHRCRHPL